MVSKLIAFGAALALLLASCDVAKETADTSKGGAKGATGIAEKMHNGTAGDTDSDTGEGGSQSSDGQ